MIGDSCCTCPFDTDTLDRRVASMQRNLEEGSVDALRLDRELQMALDSDDVGHDIASGRKLTLPLGSYLKSQLRSLDRRDADRLRSQALQYAVSKAMRKFYNASDPRKLEQAKRLIIQDKRDVGIDDEVCHKRSLEVVAPNETVDSAGFVDRCMYAPIAEEGDFVVFDLVQANADDRETRKVKVVKTGPTDYAIQSLREDGVLLSSQKRKQEDVVEFAMGGGRVLRFRLASVVSNGVEERVSCALVKRIYQDAQCCGGDGHWVKLCGLGTVWNATERVCVPNP